MEECKNKKLIFAGPLQHGNKAGGVVVLFEDLAKEVQLNHILLDTNGDNYCNRLFLLFNFIRHCFIAAINNYEISLHGTASDFKYLGLILVIFNKITGVRYNCRKFAGDFDIYYEKMNPFFKLTTRMFLQYSECNFFEPMHLVNYFQHLNPRTYWFPNYRNKCSHRAQAEFTGKFVFVGHVKREKGVDTLLKLRDFLKKGWTIDIYGPLTDYVAADLPYEGSVVYRGVLQPEEVQEILSEYNCLILPSYREGYPGVVIEAFSVGLPVIASRLPSLQEMIDETSGVLTEPGSAKSVLGAMQKIATEYSHYQNGSLKRFDIYEKEKVLNNYVSLVGMNKFTT